MKSSTIAVPELPTELWASEAWNGWQEGEFTYSNAGWAYSDNGVWKRDDGGIRVMRSVIEFARVYRSSLMSGSTPEAKYFSRRLESASGIKAILSLARFPSPPRKK